MLTVSGKLPAGQVAVAKVRTVYHDCGRLSPEEVAFRFDSDQVGESDCNPCNPSESRDGLRATSAGGGFIQISRAGWLGPEWVTRIARGVRVTYAREVWVAHSDVRKRGKSWSVRVAKARKRASAAEQWRKMRLQQSSEEKGRTVRRYNNPECSWKERQSNCPQHLSRNLQNIIGCLI